MRIKFILAVSLAITGLLPSTAIAATNSYSGIALSPSIEQLVLNPAQASVDYQIKLDNNESTPITVTASSVDFKSLNDSGGVAFITSDPASLEHKYGLANWISLPAGPIILPANGGQSINVSITNRADLAPGGHYAAILFKVLSPAVSGSNTVEVSQVISSLVFVRKTGGDIYSLRETKAVLHRKLGWFGWPTSIDNYFSNNGNVQTAPRGVVELNGAHIILNPDSNLILPESTRLIRTSLGTSSPGLFPRTYQVRVSYRPDESQILRTYTASFIYISWQTIVVLALAVYLLFRLFKLRFWATLRRVARQLRKLVFIWLVANKTFQRLVRLAIRALKYLLKSLAGLLVKLLVILDTWAGRAWIAWDKRKAKKAKRR